MSVPPATGGRERRGGGVFSRRTRSIVILLSALMGVLAAMRGAWPSAVLFAAVAVLYLAGLWLNGPVWQALRKARRGDLAGAEALLDEVRTPDRLSDSQRPYYHFLRGVLEQQRGHADRAEAHFRSAVEGRLRTDNDRALVNGQLAALALARGDADACRAWLLAARDCNPGEEVALRLHTLEQRLEAGG